MAKEFLHEVVAKRERRIPEPRIEGRISDILARESSRHLREFASSSYTSYSMGMGGTYSTVVIGTPSYSDILQPAYIDEMTPLACEDGVLMTPFGEHNYIGSRAGTRLVRTEESDNAVGPAVSQVGPTYAMNHYDFSTYCDSMGISYYRRRDVQIGRIPIAIRSMQFNQHMQRHAFMLLQNHPHYPDYNLLNVVSSEIESGVFQTVARYICARCGTIFRMEM